MEQGNLRLETIEAVYMCIPSVLRNCPLENSNWVQISMLVCI